MTDPGTDVHFNILGPLQICTSDGERLEVGGPSQRRLLAVLLLNANTVVAADRLADWCGLSPGGLRTAVSRLRRDVGSASVLREPPGYVIRTSDLDADRFEQLVTQARSQPVDSAIASLDTALGYWRGEALPDYAHEPWAQPTVIRLDELRSAAREERAERLLAVGRWTDVIVDMESLSAASPLRERPRSLLMRALAADGRQTESLRSYQQYRQYLTDEIGTEPSKDLRALEAKIVAGWRDQTEALEANRPGIASAVPSPADSGAMGNLRLRTTSFLGRDTDIKQLIDVVRRHQLVTLTGIGGVGKTSLAVEVANELSAEFSEGVWFVELTSLEDPGAVADLVASTLGVTATAGKSVVRSLTETLTDKNVLVVLDNCEHVLDAAASLVQELLGTSATARILATSREGLRVSGERLWPVRPLAIDQGENSPAVQLFIDRAVAVNASFGDRSNSSADKRAVIEVCERLDGIPLAIELAAARVLTLTPGEVAARLDERFRLLGSSSRGPQRHRTLRQAVQWSYDLLTADEQRVFRSCSVFVSGFDIEAATAVSPDLDEFEIVDALESLVRKSLLTVDHSTTTSRYSMLETIRHFGEDVAGAAEGELGDLRRRHAEHFAAQSAANFLLWDGPELRVAVDWVEQEFDDLRAAFRHSVNDGEVDTASTIAAHVAMIAFTLQRLEPVGWAEELLASAPDSTAKHLPRLYTAASLCSYLGRHQDALVYLDSERALRDGKDFEPFSDAWVQFRRAVAHLDEGDPNAYLAICSELAKQSGLGEVVGLCGLAAFLPSQGHSEKAILIAERAVEAAANLGHPYWVAFAHVGASRAFAYSDPSRSLAALRSGRAYARQQSMPYWEAVLAREAGGLEAVHGDPAQALELLRDSLESFYQAGNNATIAWILASLAVLAERTGYAETAATIYGATTSHQIGDVILGLNPALDRLRDQLGRRFDELAATGAEMTTTKAVRYARTHIEATSSAR